MDLRGRDLTPAAFWEAIAAATQMPPWFGRNLDAWADALRGGISPMLDAQPLVVRADPVGIFAPCEPFGRKLAGIFAAAAPRARLELTPPSRRQRREAEAAGRPM